MPDQLLNRLYDFPQSDDNPLPVAREPLRLTVHPQDNMTPGPPANLPDVQTQPEVAPYKFTPVEGNPFEGMTHKEDKRKTLSQIWDESSLGGKAAMGIAGLPYGLTKSMIVDPIQSAADLMHQVQRGENIELNPETIGKGMAAAGLAGTGGLAGVGEGGVALGSGPVKVPGLSKNIKEYVGEHGAPDNESGAPMHNVANNGIYPEDFYSHEGLRYYGTGEDAIDRTSYNKILNVKNKPDEKVAIWRAIPWNGEGKPPNVTLNSNNINPGDWVTISRQYAKDHGEQALNGKYVIAKSMVPAKELFTNGDSFHEWGWHPELKSDTSIPGSAVGSLMKKAPTFYSAVEHAVDNIKQAKAPAEQWLATISNSKGVKPEELDWTGLKSFLEENKGKSITKEDIQSHLNDNKVELKEVNKGESNYYRSIYKDSLPRNLENYGKLNEIKTIEDVSLAKKYDVGFRETVKGKTDNEIFDAVQKAKNLPNLDHIAGKQFDTKAEAEAAIKGNEHHLDIKEDNVYKDTKYKDYQLPGGENYREKLLTLPENSPEIRRIKDIKKRLYEITNLPAKETDPETVQGLAYQNEFDSLRAEKKKLIDKIPNSYKSSHWDEPNILAHVRMNDRIIEGKKSLHLEEIQSDFLQEHRNEQAKIVEAVNKDFDSIADRMVKAGVIKKVCD